MEVPTKQRLIWYLCLLVAWVIPVVMYRSAVVAVSMGVWVLYIVADSIRNADEYGFTEEEKIDGEK